MGCRETIITLLVNEYKFPNGIHTSANATYKSRMVIEGQNMIKGVHFEDRYAHTPKMETNRIMSALTVLLKLHRMALTPFDATSTALSELT